MSSDTSRTTAIEDWRTAEELRASETVPRLLLRQQAELEEELVGLRAELQEALRENHTISYSIAHDLRGPLRSIASGAQIILEDTSRLGEEARQWAHRIFAAANRMDALVLGLLEYTRLARLECSIQTVDLEEVVGQALRTQERRAPERSAEIAIERPLHSVKGDPAPLVRALDHLLSNALKFVATGVAPKVTIRTERRDLDGAGDTGRGSVRLWVEDNGIGIPLEHRGRLFGVFQNLHRREDFPGTGIGLAIARRLVERMGGTIGMESGAARGSRFYLELPGA